MKIPVVWRFLKAAGVTNDFGFDIAFGILERSEVKNKFCSSQEENINMYAGIILSSYDWLKDEEPASTTDSKSLLS